LLLKIVDTTAPVILSAPSSVTVSVGANCQGTVPNLLANVLANDNCTPAGQLVLSQSPAAGMMLGKGSYPVTISVSDAAGNTATTQVTLNVVDTTVPVISTISVTPNVLSPPNHQMVPVTVSVSATDNCDAPVNKIVSITCNEPAVAGEMQITGKLTASLAATRNGGGGGRVYTINIQSCDASGNISTGSVVVTVPQGNRYTGTKTLKFDFEPSTSDFG